ncbi:MAG: hypothetical protein AMJ56_07610 [Anaerolineae bacterium SG8_19]|nr:MAG: hypothetical protein AMJ56_07610 [Anaerolineae bacterium SG8_19]
MAKKKRFTPEERAAMFEPTYFFGYGSLMNAAGINGRHMAKKYQNSDLTPCSLRGFSRSMCAYYGGRNFYGLLEKDPSYLNGVVFRVHSWYDYRALLDSEGATSRYKKFRTYWPVRVTDQMLGWEAPKGFRVMTLVCKKDKSDLGRVERSYIRFCHQAALVWGKQFANEFLATGGVPYNRSKMANIAKKLKIKLW